MSTCFKGIHDRDRCQGVLCSLLVALCMAVYASPAFAESTISQELQKNAPVILDGLRARNCKTVGVLKFRVKMGADAPSDNVGTFNLLAAGRLENALTLAEPNPQKPIRLVRDASSVATSVKGTSHLSPEGRGKLFSLDYPVAWGESGEKLKVDAFVTGVAIVDANLQTLQLCVLGVFPKGEPIALLAPPISCQVTWDLIPELGKAFTTRGASGPQSPPNGAAREAVEFRVYYDGRPVDAREKDAEGVFWIPEPKTGQKVEFQLWRSDGLKHLVGAVLKVNGENTARKGERIASAFCRKWLLKPQASPLRIGGYQTDTERRDDFRIATPEESRELELYYGSDVGLITLELFREVGVAPPVPSPKSSPESLADDTKKRGGAQGLADASPDLAAIKKGFIPPTTPPDQEARQTQLRSGATVFASRGVITGGDESKFQIELVDCKLEEQPFMSFVLRYYKPTR